MNIEKILKTQIKFKKTNHAYLVIGEVDSSEIIKIFNLHSPDILITDEVPIKISKIREINHWVMLKPHSSLNKLVILKNFDSITLEAANTLLKTLEEPPSDTIFILQAEKIEKVLPTIQSRCQIIKEKSAESEVPEDYLSVETISRMGIAEKFTYADKISHSPSLKLILKFWEKEFREKLKNNQNVLLTLRDLESARSLLSTNTSVKLLIENILLDL